MDISFVRASLEVLERRPVSSIINILLEPPCSISRQAAETVWVATYSTSGLLNTVALVALGGFDEAHVDIKALMNIIALSGGGRFLIAHNHPHGKAAPSALDMEMTRSVARASDAIGYVLEDHLIFDSHGRCYSLAEHNLIGPREEPVLRLEVHQ